MLSYSCTSRLRVNTLMEYVAHPREKLKQLPVEKQLSGWAVVQVHRWAHGDIDTRCGCPADTRLGSSLFSSLLTPPLFQDQWRDLFFCNLRLDLFLYGLLLDLFRYGLFVDLFLYSLFSLTRSGLLTVLTLGGLLSMRTLRVSDAGRGLSICRSL